MPLANAEGPILHTTTVNGYFVRTSKTATTRLIDRTTTRLEDRLYRQRLRRRNDGQALEPAGERQREPPDQLGDRHPRAARRRDQHGRADQRGHDERARADARDRRAALHRRTRPGYPAHLRSGGITVSLAGWLLGIPIGYALARLFIWLLLEVVGIEFGFTFPLLNLLIALVGTVVLALLIMRIPLRRAVRFKPGDAIRYA